MPPNVDLNLVPRENGKQDAFHVSNMLATKPHQQYDVVIIDGLTRGDLFDIASKYVAPNGIIICDNAEGYGFYEGFKDRGFNRVDFYGNAPGILLPHCTSIFFNATSFVFDPAVPIRNIAKQP